MEGKVGSHLTKRMFILTVLTVIVLFASLFRWGYLVKAEGDLEGPEVTTLSPPPGGVISTSDPQILSFKFNDSAKLDSSVVLEVDGQAVNAAITWGDLYRTGTDEVSGEVYKERIGEDHTTGTIEASLPSLVPGEHQVFYSLKDSLGNETQGTYTFTLQEDEKPAPEITTPSGSLTLLTTSGPNVSELSPSAGATTDKAAPVFSLRFSDEQQLDPNVVVKVDNLNVVPVISWEGIYEQEYDSCTGGYYDVWVGEDRTRGIVSAQLPTLSGGQHTIYYNLKDLLGNVTENSYTFTVADTMGPVISEKTPSDGTVSSNPKPVIRAKVTDANPLVTSQIIMKLNGTPVIAGYNAVNSYVTYLVPQPLKNGTYQVEVTAVDIFGNTSLAAWSFTVNETTAPAISGNVPADGSTIGNNQPSIGASITDISGIANPVYIKLDNQNLQAIYSPETGKALVVPVNSLSDGQHTVAMTVYDFQGNKSTTAWAFTVFTAGPIVSQLSPVPGSVTDKNTPVFSLRFNAERKLNPSVVVRVDNQNVTAAVAWDGIYVQEYDSCTGDPYDVRVGDDFTNGVVSAQLPSLTGGPHTIYYNLKDQLGNVTENSYTFTVSDIKGPDITQVAPLDGAVLASPKPTIQAKIIDVNAIASGQVIMKINGSPVISSYNAVTSLVSYTPSQPLKNGLYQVEVTASDIFGNQSVKSWSFRVDEKTPPTISNLLPVNGSLTGNVKPSIEATVTDVSGIANPVYLQIDSSNFEAQYKPETGKVTYTPVQALASGEHTVNMVVYDGQGNKASANWSFTIEITGPALSDITPVPGSVTASTTLQFSARFNDPDGLDPGVIIKVDNQTFAPTITWDEIYESQYDSCTDEYYDVFVGYDYTKGLVKATLANLAAGQHTLYYKFKDKLGNVAENSYTFTITDTQGPQITIISPVDGTTIADPKPVIKAKVTDANGVATSQIVMKLDGTPVVAAFDVVSSSISYSVPTPLKNGLHRVELSAPDLLNNISTRSWSFTVSELTPPAITNMVPANNGTVGSSKPLIEATISDASGITNPVLLKIDTTTYETQYNSQTGKISYTPTLSLSLGQHTVTVTATDTQGIKSTASWTFTIDSGVPVVSGVTPPPGGVTPSMRPVFSLQWSDPHKLDAAAVVKIDGRLVTATVNNEAIYSEEYDSCTGETYEVLIGYDYTKGTVTANLSQLSLGQHTLYYSIKDQLGNAKEDTYAFTIADNQGPQVTDKYPANGSTVTLARPAITAKLSDSNNIVASSVYMVLNGQRVSSTYDVSTTTVKYQPPQVLKQGQNTIQVFAADELGNGSTTNWSFTVNDNILPKVSSLTPAANAVTGDLSPTISAKATDENGIDASRVIMKLDGAAVGTFNPATGVVSYKPDYALAVGTYTVALSVYDVFSNKTDVSWSFTVKDVGAPQITNLLPPPTMGTRAVRPTISATVADAGGLDLSKVTITIDGVPLSAVFKPERPGSIVGGTVSAVPAADLSAAKHTAVVKVFDKAGNSQQKTWQFGVNTFTEMAAENLGDCTGCHNEGTSALEQKHMPETGDCGICHDRGAYNHGESDCSDCHGAYHDYWPPPIGSIACTQCHNSQNWDVIPTHGGPLLVTPPHNNSALGQDCVKCHFSSLTKEHNIYVEGRGVAFNCSTCHQSTDSKVKEAIAAGNTACSACHGDNINHEALHKDDLNAKCAGCHTNNIFTDHLVNRPNLGITCQDCHPEAGATTYDLSVTNNKLCSQCHTTGHDLTLTLQTPSDIPLYSSVQWSQPQDNKIFASESWIPQEFTGQAKLLISGRSNGITGDAVWNFYKTQMALNGWALDSQAPAAGSDFFNVTFVKNARKARISFYGGADHNASPVVSEGYRVEILYQ